MLSSREQDAWPAASAGQAAVAQSLGFNPRYAVEFRDITNRQDWAACESVPRGLASPHALPGPLSPEEDGVCQFGVLVAGAYRGRAVHAPGARQH